MKRHSLILLFLLISYFSLAQEKYEISGKVTNASDNSDMEMVAIGIKELNLWTSSDMKGNYYFKNIPAGEYTIQASCLGFELYEQAFSVPLKPGGLLLKMNPTTLALDEVVVLAKEGKKLASTSTINQSALEHIQPVDLSDVMQLLPGQVTVNPDMSDARQLSIREISADDMATLGTLIVVDGASISNDANLQFTQTTTASTGVLTSNFSSTATGGTDVRQIPVDNIESIEVVRGIASAEEGDLLGGMVKVNLKKGHTPWTGKIKLDPNLKQLYVGKGFTLPEAKGTINFDLDYTNSVEDIRFQFKTFNRLAGSLAYSNTFFKQAKPLSINFTTRYSDNRDTEKTDPDMENYEKYESHDWDLGFILSGKWSLNTRWLTNISYNFSTDIQHQVSREIEVESTPAGRQPQPVSYVSGEFVSDYLPLSYTSDLTIDGRPFYFNGKIVASKVLHVNELSNNLKGGVEYKLSGNNGDGRVYDMNFPPTPTSSSDARPRSYKDIPSLGQLSYFMEDELSLPIGKTKLDVQAGLRFTSLQPEGLFSSSEGITMWDPRTNLKYTLVDNKSKGLSHLAVRFGYGVFSKAPLLVHLYPDKSYTDKVSFNYYDPPGSLLILSTQVVEDTRNYDLKPAYNRKMEAGLDLEIFGKELLFTGFYEKMTDGFYFKKTYNLFSYNVYDELEDAGLNPYYVEGEGVAYVDPSTLEEVFVGVSQDTIWTSYSYPENGLLSVKKGLEYTIDLGKINMLRTSFVIDGAYMWVKKQEMSTYLLKPTAGYLGGPNPLVGVYPGGGGTIRKRFNTNLRTVTHIKELRMIFTLTTQIIWFQKYRSIYEDEDGNILVYTETPVDNIYDDKTQIKYLDPIGYYDLTGEYFEFDRSQATSKPYSDLIDQQGNALYFIEKTYPTTVQLNLRLTKELGDLANLSFFVNNLTNYQPLKTIKGMVNSYVRGYNTSPLYFGAELKLKL